MARKALHKENLIQTAMRLFRTQGFAATGLQQIITESGAPKGSLYHYFPSGKDALAAAAVKLAGEMVTDMMQQHLANSENAAEFVNSVIRTYANWMCEGGFASGCPIATTMLECAPQSPVITGAGATAIEGWIAVAAEAFVRDGWDSQQANQRAEAFIAGLQGALILTRIHKSTKSLENCATAFANSVPAD